MNVLLAGCGLCLIIGFALGYIAGRVDRLVTGVPGPLWEPTRTAPRRQTQTLPTKNAAAIQIDTGKVVTKLDTSAIQKPEHVTLGTVTTKQEDINGAASRLAQLKGK